VGISSAKRIAGFVSKVEPYEALFWHNKWIDGEELVESAVRSKHSREVHLECQFTKIPFRQTATVTRILNSFHRIMIARCI
jgi:hypothetical protein